MDPRKWTFDQGIRAEGPRFSVPVPDGYDVLTEDSNPELDYPLIVLPSGDDPEEDDRILYRSNVTPGDEQFKALGLPEIMWAIGVESHVKYITDASRKLLDTFLLKGDGVDCLVLLIGAAYGKGFGYYIHPLSKTTDFLRVVLYFEDRAKERDYREGLAKFVSGIRMNEQCETDSERQLREFTAHKADAVDVAICFETIVKLLENANKRLFVAWQRLKATSLEDLVFKVAEKRSDFFARIARRYYVAFADVIDAQRGFGASEVEIGFMTEAALLFESRLVLPFDCKDPQIKERMVTEGHLTTPPEIAQVHARLV